MVVGISGKIGSGKDEIGKILQYLSSTGMYSFKQGLSYKGYLEVYDKREHNYQIKKYADKLKDMVCLLIGCTREQLEDREFKEKPLGEDWIVHWYKDNKGRKFLTKTASEAVNHPDRAVAGQDMLTPRLLLQLLGTECGRQIIHPNIWVNALFADYKGKYLGATDDMKEPVEMCFPNWIITDVRFPNEAKAIKDKGGILIRINRPQYLDNGLVVRKDEHLSETSLDDYDKFDHVIENDGTVQDLIDKVKALNIV